MFRPLTPHLLVYKAQLNSILSVFHRASAIVLSTCCLTIVYSGSVVACGLANYSIYWLVYVINTSLSGILSSVLLVALLNISFHVFNGVRHLLWDSANDHLLGRKATALSNIIVIFLCSLACLYVCVV